MTVTSAIRGWCPGTLRPMLTGDGFLVRIKCAGGRLTPHNLMAIAELGRCFGNGAFDLTQRASLQLRGVRQDNIAPLQTKLDHLGFLPRDSASEQILNIIGAPLAGLDPEALADGSKLLADLENVLVMRTDLHDLPGKFGFAIDDGSSLSSGNAPADIRLEAVSDGTKVRIALRLAGDDQTTVLTEPDDAAATAGALAAIFLNRHKASPALRRMRHAVALYGAHSLFADAGLKSISLPQHPPVSMAAVLGLHAMGEKGMRLGLATAFGRWSSDDLEWIAQACCRHGVHDLRLTHWRSVLLPGMTPQSARELYQMLAEKDFILSAGDPRLTIIACPGAPACASATVTTRDAANALAGMTGDYAAADKGSLIRLHVSGCAKGCAYPHPAPLTLVGREGAYDLVKNDLASGQPFARGLNPDQARCEIAQTMAWLAPS